MTGWPLPFSGIKVAIGFYDASELNAFLDYLGAGCPDHPSNKGTEYMHGHHVAVEFGENRVHGSELLADCYVHWSENVIH